jgi:signal transduction histidine kinase
LRLQSRLAILLILNIVATGVALAVLARAYVASERSLREVKVLATDILASMDQGVISTDNSATIMCINPRGSELLQPAEPRIGTNLHDLPAQYAPLANMCQQVIFSHAGMRDQDYTDEQNGHIRTLRAGCSLLRNEQQQHLGTVIHFRDVTEKALIEQRLRRMERFMGLGSLAAGLHHEIKNPLSALSLHVQLLDEALSAEDPSPEIQEMLDVLTTEVRRIAAVLEGFRDYASISQLHLTEVDLTRLLSKLKRFLQPQAQQQSVEIELDFVPDQAIVAAADPDRMEQVLLNLAVNALEAMPQGGTLAMRLHALPEQIQIEVADTGSGVPEQLRERIFDPYFTTRSSGTGMGLALSEKIIRQHEGTIDLTSGSQGTIFTVTLPRRDRARQANSSPTLSRNNV